MADIAVCLRRPNVLGATHGTARQSLSRRLGAPLLHALRSIMRRMVCGRIPIFFRGRLSRRMSGVAAIATTQRHWRTTAMIITRVQTLWRGGGGRAGGVLWVACVRAFVRARVFACVRACSHTYLGRVRCAEGGGARGTCEAGCERDAYEWDPGHSAASGDPATAAAWRPGEHKWQMMGGARSSF